MCMKCRKCRPAQVAGLPRGTYSQKFPEVGNLCWPAERPELQRAYPHHVLLPRLQLRRQSGLQMQRAEGEQVQLLAAFMRLSLVEGSTSTQSPSLSLAYFYYVQNSGRHATAIPRQ